MYANAGLPFNIPESYFMTEEECDQWAQSELISFGDHQETTSQMVPRQSTHFAPTDHTPPPLWSTTQEYWVVGLTNYIIQSW